MRKIILFCLVLFTFLNVKATHIMGGEITWECIKNGVDEGKYIFTLKVYRDCSGANLSATTQFIDVWNHPTVTQITANFISNSDISPNGNAQNSGNSCLDCAAGNPGSVEEYVYQSAPVNLPGVPPAAGWSFTWDLCCRNGAITNLVLSSTTSPSEGFTLRATMFPYIDPISGLPVDGDPCFDSSPLFNEEPKTIICTGYPFSYSHNASDPELDSIVYSWDEPLDDAVAFGVFNPPIDPSPIPFLAPYSFNSPLPGNPILDANTGEISYNSNVSGNFVTVVRVDAFKCGQKVASIYREIQAEVQLE